MKKEKKLLIAGIVPFVLAFVFTIFYVTIDAGIESIRIMNYLTFMGSILLLGSPLFIAAIALIIYAIIMIKKEK